MIYNSLKLIRTSGLVEPSLLGPCTGNGNCRTCAHFDELMDGLESTGEGEKSSPHDSKRSDTLRKMKEHHKKIRGRHKTKKKKKKTAALTTESLHDFNSWMPKGWHIESKETGSGSRTPDVYPGVGFINDSDVHNPLPPERVRLRPHDYLVLHNPTTGNRLHIIDHSELAQSPAESISTVNEGQETVHRSLAAPLVWNIKSHGPAIAEAIRHLDRIADGTTLDLTSGLRREGLDYDLGSITSATRGQTSSGTMMHVGRNLKTIHVADPVSTLLGVQSKNYDAFALKPHNLKRLQQQLSDPNAVPQISSWGSGESLLSLVSHEVGHLHQRNRNLQDGHFLDLMGRAVAAGGPHLERALKHHLTYLGSHLREDESLPHTEDDRRHLILPFKAYSNLGQAWDRVTRERSEGADYFFSALPHEGNSWVKSLFHSAPVTVQRQGHFRIAPMLMDRGVPHASEHPLSPFITAMTATGLSGYSLQNPGEHYAEHYSAWHSPLGRPNRFTALMAHHFGWSNPYRRSTIADPADVFKEECPCCNLPNKQSVRNAEEFNKAWIGVDSNNVVLRTLNKLHLQHESAMDFHQAELSRHSNPLGGDEEKASDHRNALMQHGFASGILSSIMLKNSQGTIDESEEGDYSQRAKHAWGLSKDLGFNRGTEV